MLTKYLEGHMTRWIGPWVGWVLSTVVVIGCTNSKNAPHTGEESVTSTSVGAARSSAEPADAATPAPSCGREVQTHGRGYDEVARKCLWDAYQASKPASLSLTRHTIEGDPITFTIRIQSPSSIEVIEDNRDRFGSAGVRRSTCTKLERSASTDGRAGFSATGCSGPLAKIDIP